MYVCMHEGVCGWVDVMCVCGVFCVGRCVCGVSVSGCGCVGYPIFVPINLITVCMASTTSLTLKVYIFLC